jgi:Flp pilus assembly protein TadG
MPMSMPRASPTALRMLLRAPPRGGAIIEFALIMPFLGVLLVGLCDLGFGLYGSMQVHAAAEAGAQYASRNQWNPIKIAAAVTGATGASGISATPAPYQTCGCTNNNIFTQVGTPTNGTCSSLTCNPSGNPGLYGSISAQLQYQTVLPYPGLPATLTLTGQTYRRLN